MKGTYEMEIKMLSPSLKKRIIDAIIKTWKVVGQDDNGACRCSGEFMQDEIVNLMLDSDEMEMHGRDQEAVAEFRKLFYEDQEEIVRDIFKMNGEIG
jgi:hypothetical protein